MERGKKKKKVRCRNLQSAHVGKRRYIESFDTNEEEAFLTCHSLIIYTKDFNKTS